MKRICAALLVASLLLSGCGFFQERIMEPVTFHYLQSDYLYGKDPSVIVAEEREASGHRDDLSYLMALYLMGPVQKDSVSPLPTGTRILKPEQHGKTVTLELTNPSYTFEDTELTLACACLSLTCLDITDAEEVVITYQDRVVTMTRDNLTMMDSSVETIASEETH